MAYFLITASSDGINIQPLERSELNERLNEMSTVDFADTLPDTDPNYWGEKSVLIKGNIVVPVPKQAVTTWEVP